MKKIIITFAMLICFVASTYSCAFASSLKDLEQLDYSDEYKKYLALPEEERENAYIPQMYDYKPDDYEMNTFEKIKELLLVGAALPSRYSLMDANVIPNNVTIKDQGDSNTCWAFAFAGAVESTLGMQDLKNGNTSNVYDFSERHLEYGITRDNYNGEINKIGLDRTINTGGSFFMAESYATHGLGLVDEADMPFRDESGNIIPFDPISLNELTSKEVKTQLYDTIYFESVKAGEDHSAVMAKMKEHIMNHGGLVAQIYGDNKDNGFINLNNGAIFVDAESATNLVVDHEVIIIGWDDNYPAQNFENEKLTKNGAWIIKNSWGTNREFGSLNDYKIYFRSELFKLLSTENLAEGINSAEDITDEQLLRFFNALYEDQGVTFTTLEEALIRNATDSGYAYDSTNDKLALAIGDNGIFYVSYEDAFIYTGVKGIEKIEYDKEYDNIHTYDDYGFVGMSNVKETYELDTIYSTSRDEYIKDVGLYLYNPADVYVYVNTNSNSLEDSKFQAVQLKSGINETIIDGGYHTFEFAKPLKIGANSNYVVRIKVVPKGTDNWILLDGATGVPNAYKYRETATDKCYVKYGGERFNISSEANCDSTVFVHTSYTDDSEKGLVINPGPTKTTYFEGEDFDATGMKVFLEYNNGTRKEITNYTISNNKNLKLGQTKVTITYGGYTVDQPITVKKNAVARLEIISNPTKTEYKEGHDFEPAGLKIKAIYENGEEKEVTNYEILDQYDLKNGQTSVTVSFGEKTVSIPITVEENALLSIVLKKNPTKTEYVEGQKFNPEGMEIEAEFEDGLKKNIRTYVVTNGDKLEAGQESVEITYEGKSLTIPVTVVEKKASKIEISQKPKVEYEIGESLDLKNGKLTITYNDESTETISLDSKDVEVTGFNSEEAGEITLEVKYLDLTTTLKVKINELKLPENSNFDNAKYSKGTMSGYFYEEIKKDTAVYLEGTISSIVKSDVNDSAKYYVYVGSQSDEKDIEDWTYIGENKIENGNLNFKVNLTAQSNMEDLQGASTYFIYVKEVATRGSQEKILITKGIPFDKDLTEFVEYIDDVKFTEPSNNNNGNNNNSNKADPTTANGVLPQTGEIAILSAVVFVLGIAIFEYRKLKKYKDIK